MLPSKVIKITLITFALAACVFILKDNNVFESSVYSYKLTIELNQRKAFGNNSRCGRILSKLRRKLRICQLASIILRVTQGVYHRTISRSRKPG
jgi:hypothetical protein